MRGGQFALSKDFSRVRVVPNQNARISTDFLINFRNFWTEEEEPDWMAQSPSFSTTHRCTDWYTCPISRWLEETSNSAAHTMRRQGLRRKWCRPSQALDPGKIRRLSHVTIFYVSISSQLVAICLYFNSFHCHWWCWCFPMHLDPIVSLTLFDASWIRLLYSHDVHLWESTLYNHQARLKWFKSSACGYQ